MAWLDDKEKVASILKKYKYVFLILILGILLMMIPEKEATSKTEVNQQEIPSDTLQIALEKILTKVEGAGKVNVLLTEYTGEEMVYQVDKTRSDASDTSNTKTETVILTDSERNENGMICKIIAPVYKGALIVCQGADSAVVRLAVIEAVSKVTGLSTNQISVLKMK